MPARAVLPLEAVSLCAARLRGFEERSTMRETSSASGRQSSRRIRAHDRAPVPQGRAPEDFSHVLRDAAIARPTWHASCSCCLVRIGEVAFAPGEDADKTEGEKMNARLYYGEHSTVVEAV